MRVTKDCAKRRACDSLVPDSRPAAKRSNAASKWRSRPRAPDNSWSTASRVAGDFANARSTSRHMMFPDPSQMEFTGISRAIRANDNSSV
jgi:hypothetical protein